MELIEVKSISGVSGQPECESFLDLTLPGLSGSEFLHLFWVFITPTVLDSILFSPYS